MNGEKFISSMPSQRVKTIGYFDWSRVKRMVAFESRWRSTRLLSSMAPVTNSPAGTMTRPPPAFVQAAIADLKASVLSFALSPTAPYFVTSNVRDGNDGGLMRERIRGSSTHGSTGI